MKEKGLAIEWVIAEPKRLFEHALAQAERRAFPAPFAFEPAGSEIPCPKPVDRKVPMRLRIARVQGDRTVIAKERLVRPHHVVQAGATVDMGLGIIRLQRDGAIVTCKRLIEATKPPQGPRFVAEHFGDAGRNGQRLVVDGKSLVETLQINQHYSEIVQSRDEIGLDRDCIEKMLTSCVVFVQFDENAAEAVVGVGPVRSNL